MDDDEKWLTAEFKQGADQQSFIKKAILLEAAELVKEQSKRIEQSEMEIDGRIWSPKNW